MNINTDLILLFWKGHAVADAYRTKAIAINKEIRVHSKKDLPVSILDRSRPNEERKHKDFRLASYKPFTSGWYGKILTQIKKIQRAEDWRISYSEEVSRNPLEEYCEKNFPEFDSLENWFFQFGIGPLLDDPNGAALVVPKNLDKLLLGIRETTENFEPIVKYIDSGAVLYHNEDLFIYETLEGADLPSGLRDESDQRRAIYFFDRTRVVRAKGIRDGRYRNSWNETSYQYNFGEVPAVKFGGVLREVDANTGQKLYDSFISPILAHWEEAIELQSDHSLNLKLHLHPDRWQYASDTCDRCQGVGTDNRAPMVSGQRPPCQKCQGKKYIYYVSPFGVSTITPIKGADGLILPPAPGAGYVERPVESIGFLKAELKDKIFDGLAAVNMEYLGSVLLAQSGTAKAQDRDDSDAFVYSVASHVVKRLLKDLYFFINEWRYNYLDAGKRAALLPVLQVPKKYNLVTAEVWRERLSAAKKDGASAQSIAFLEVALARTEYGADSIEFRLVSDSISLDPLFGKTEEEKASAVLNSGCSQDDYIISTKISAFLRRAYEANPRFFDLSYPDKIAVLTTFAQETRSIKTLGGLGFSAEPGAIAAPGSAAPADVELDARAKLRGTAGGVDSLLKIEAALAAGTTTYEAAIAKAKTIFGYSDEEAREMITKPEKMNLKPEPAPAGVVA